MNEHVASIMHYCDGIMNLQGASSWTIWNKLDSFVSYNLLQVYLHQENRSLGLEFFVNLRFAQRGTAEQSLFARGLYDLRRTNNMIMNLYH